MIQIKQVKCTLDDTAETLRLKIVKKLRITEDRLLSYKIVKESLDARKNETPHFIYTIHAIVDDETNMVLRSADYSFIQPIPYVLPVPTSKLETSPIIVGFGPAGMFAALALASQGLKPHIYERGKKVEDRVKDVTAFWQEGILNPESNVQFGEGGAGTFSDGKLTTRVKDDRIAYILEAFVEAGAPEDILYLSHPHLGTDRLRDIVKNIRLKIESLGGIFHFEACVSNLLIEDNQVTGIVVNKEKIHSNHVILAIGHSSKDTLLSLEKSKVAMECKSFAIGLRIEHKQAFIDQRQYGKYADHPRLKTADYRLSYQASNNRGVYTFCMCPGGSVVAASSEENTVVTNGMSEFARDHINANSAILVSVNPEDYGNTLKSGLKFQKELETKAFKLGGNNYHAPVQLVQDYLNNVVSTKFNQVLPSYSLGTNFADLNQLFSTEINLALHEGLRAFDHKVHGFASEDAILTGVESRSSSIVRIMRDPISFQSTNIKGLYPCGEGAGYAGGIISSALDGLRVSEAILKNN